MARENAEMTSEAIKSGVVEINRQINSENLLNH